MSSMNACSLCGTLNRHHCIKFALAHICCCQKHSLMTISWFVVRALIIRWICISFVCSCFSEIMILWQYAIFCGFLFSSSGFIFTCIGIRGHFMKKSVTVLEMTFTYCIRSWKDCPVFSLSMDSVVCGFVSYLIHQIQKFIGRMIWQIPLNSPSVNIDSSPCQIRLGWGSMRTSVQREKRKFCFCNRYCRILSQACTKFVCIKYFAQTSDWDLLSFRVDLIAFLILVHFQVAF
jgi:hypothetical protein